MPVGFFDRGFQPHLDQMQHRSLDDRSNQRPHKLGMWNTSDFRSGIFTDSGLLTGTSSRTIEHSDQVLENFQIGHCKSYD